MCAWDCRLISGVDGSQTWLRDGVFGRSCNAEFCILPLCLDFVVPGRVMLKSLSHQYYYIQMIAVTSKVSSFSLN